MILDLYLALNFVVFGKGISHDGNQHVEQMENEHEGRNVVKSSQYLALNESASCEA